MSEVEKMFENADIKKEWLYTVKQFNQYYLAKRESIIQQAFLFNERKTAKITNARKLYPEFTAEKQLKIIGIITTISDLHISGNYMSSIAVNDSDVDEYTVNDIEQFDERLAALVNKMWQDLTEAEKAQIKRILE